MSNANAQMLHKRPVVFRPALLLVLVLMLAMAGAGAAIASSQGGLSYSPEQWPKRWSSAIHQQQNGQYPTRQADQAPPPALPGTDSEVSDQDLFYSPSTQGRYGQTNARQRRPHRAGQSARFRRFSGAAQSPRRAAFAYYGMPALQYRGYNTVNQGFPYGASPLGIDPVLGHPGMGIPIMPGVPYGYPIGAYPLGGYPGFPGAGYPGVGYPGGMWNPPFGAW